MIIQETIDKLNKVFKRNILYAGTDNRFIITRIPTGSYALDYITGGGIPRGRITEFYGNYSSGKSGHALRIISYIQHTFGQPCLYVNVEDTFDAEYAGKLGVDLGSLVIFKPETGEDVVNFLYTCLKEGVFGGIVIDSIAAMLPAAEANAEAEKELMGRHGKLTSSLMRKVNSASNGCTIIILNQLRDKLGVMYGKKETTPGGRAVQFYASMRVELRKGESIKEGTDKSNTKVVGRRIHILLEKDKTGPNEQKTASYIYYFKGTHIDNEQEIIDLAALTGQATKQRGIIGYAGSSYREAQFKELLREDPKVRRILLRKIMSDNISNTSKDNTSKKDKSNE